MQTISEIYNRNGRHRHRTIRQNRPPARQHRRAGGTMVIRLNSYTRLQVSLEQVNLISKTIQLDDDDPRIAALAAKVRDVRDYQFYALEEI